MKDESEQELTVMPGCDGLPRQQALIGQPSGARAGELAPLLHLLLARFVWLQAAAGPEAALRRFVVWGRGLEVWLGLGVAWVVPWSLGPHVPWFQNSCMLKP